MKIDRRSFLSFVVGGAAGTALTPIPWKLTDDSAIWTQMWPWTPVPANGEVAFADTVCDLCPGGCGISVRKVDERAIKIEGKDGHPVNAGGICSLGLSGLQLLYGPTRVKQPMKRVGNRGDGQWQPISWDAAIEEVAQNLNEIAAAGKANQVACIADSDRGSVPGLLNRFLQAYGSPNFIKMPASEDAYELAIKKMHGVAATAGFDVENADFVISFGSGVIQGWGAPVRMIKANSAWKESGAKLTQVEPRRSITAAKADNWLPIKPGTETTLAMGLAYLIVKDYAPQAGSEALKASLEAYYPTKVADETGLDEDVIIKLAGAFARAGKPLALYGKGRGTTPGSVGEAMAVHTLNVLVGNINKKGGVWLVDGNETVAWPAFTTAAGATGARVDGAGSGQFKDSKYLPSRLVPAVLTDEYPLQALFVSKANPLYSLPDSQNVKKAFAKIPYIVSFSAYMDETAANADLILPNHNYLERLEDVPAPLGYPEKMVLLAQPVVEPQFDTRHTGDVVIALAGAVGGSVAEAFAWENYEACLQEILGDHWDTLQEQGYVVNAGAALATDLAALDFAGLAAGPVAIEGDASEYPLVFTPYDSLRLSSGYIGNPPFMTKTVEDTILKGNDSLVEINSVTAKKARLREGDAAVIETPRGRAKVRVHLYDGIRPGVIAMPRGLGHTAYDKYLADKGININELIGPVEDPASGLDAAWGIRAKLSKA
ncbi:MAG: molybdopterin-dependent oxidoreductase [Desulfobacterales bacterium]|nr:molybdopterin-dependent oxidoreductase [Desulfobacterales bacterium]